VGTVAWDRCSSRGREDAEEMESEDRRGRHPVAVEGEGTAAPQLGRSFAMMSYNVGLPFRLREAGDGTTHADRWQPP